MKFLPWSKIMKTWFSNSKLFRFITLISEILGVILGLMDALQKPSLVMFLLATAYYVGFLTIAAYFTVTFAGVCVSLLQDRVPDGVVTFVAGILGLGILGIMIYSLFTGNSFKAISSENTGFFIFTSLLGASVILVGSYFAYRSFENQ
jgi:hypothetical protein